MTCLYLDMTPAQLRAEHRKALSAHSAIIDAYANGHAKAEEMRQSANRIKTIIAAYQVNTEADKATR